MNFKQLGQFFVYFHFSISLHIQNIISGSSNFFQESGNLFHCIPLLKEGRIFFDDFLNLILQEISHCQFNLVVFYCINEVLSLIASYLFIKLNAYLKSSRILILQLFATILYCIQAMKSVVLQISICLFLTSSSLLLHSLTC